MPRTLDEGFRDFLYNLTPSSTESTAAKSHRLSIQSCLKANFGLDAFFRSGSFGNGTSIYGYSDVDYFAVIPTKSLTQTSSASLRKIRDALDARFPRTGVAVSTPAVRVPFGNLAAESTEVVPADYVGRTVGGGYNLYEIADGDDGWMRSSPDAHNAYVARVDSKLDGRLKPLIRFVKAWKYLRSVPISSFYLELRITQYASAETYISYDEDIARVLSRLEANELAKLQDPLGISGYISACATQAQLADALSKVHTARTRAQKAVQARKDGDLKDAFGWWDLLYGQWFPSYYR